MYKTCYENLTIKNIFFMAEFAPYHFHKIWDTPPIFRQKTTRIDSPQYQCEGLLYQILLVRPQEGSPHYIVAVRLNNPPPGDHTVKLTLKLMGKKQKLLYDNFFTFNEDTQAFVAQDTIVPVDEMNELLNKGRVGIDLTIDFSGNTLKAQKFIDYKSLTGHVGLINMAATCYMNSILEMLFYIPAFRKLIYSIPKHENSIPYSLQRLFCLMQLSPTSPSTQELIHSFGWTDRDSFIQNDVQEFLRVLISNLEEKLDKTELKGRIQTLFSGESVQQIKCVNSKFMKETPDTFYDLSLVVKGKKNIFESLEEFTEEEVLEGANQYEIEPGHKEDAIRSTKLKRLPPVLNVHLARFQYSPTSPTGMEKVRDLYEFPTEFDIGKYTTEPESKVEYQLVSILAHIGGSFGGHYIAYCKSKGEWFRFNDEVVEKVTENDAVAGTFGGDKSNIHAYYLCYVKKSDADWVLDENFELPEFLSQYYESVKEDMDPNIVAVTIVNQDNKKIVLKKSDKVEKILQQCPGAKELWLANDKGFPIRWIGPKQELSQVLNRKAKIFAADFSSATISNPRVFHVKYFVRQAARMIDLEYMPFPYSGKPELLPSLVSKALSLPAGTKMNIFTSDGKPLTDLNQCEDGVVLLQAADLSAKQPKLEPEHLEGIVRIRDLIPGIVLDTVPRFINHTSRCIRVKINGLLPETKIEIPDIMPFKILLKCIREHFKIPDTDGIAVYLKEGGDLINDRMTKKINEALEIKEFSQYMEVPIYVTVYTGISQAQVDSRVPLHIKVMNELTEFVKDFNYEAEGEMTVSDLLKKISQDAFQEEKNMRLLSIVCSRIDRIIAPTETLGNLRNLTLRADVIPDDQLTSNKLVKVSFATDPRNPMETCLFTPFLISVDPEESFGLTECRILSMISKDIGSPNFMVFTGDDGPGVKFFTLQENDILYNFLRTDKAELFILVPISVLLQMLEKEQNRDVKILN